MERYRWQVADADGMLSHMLGHNPQFNSSSEKQWPSHADLAFVFNETADVKKRIAELESRLREWKVLG